MQLKTVPIILAMGALAACSHGGPQTVELDPENVNRPVTAPDNPSWIERMLGQDPRPNAGPCPLMGVLYDNARIVEFGQPGVQRLSNVSYTGELRAVRGLCRYVDADPIRMGMEIDMAFGRGDAAPGTTHRYRYWVAVTRRGGAPIARQVYDVDVSFGNERVVTRQERISTISIPRANGDISGANFEILVGFELTPEQIAFNREGRRFLQSPGTPASGAQTATPGS